MTNKEKQAYLEYLQEFCQARGGTTGNVPRNITRQENVRTAMDTLVT